MYKKARVDNIPDLCEYIIDYINFNNLGIISFYKLQNLLCLIQITFFINYDCPCFEKNFYLYEAGAFIDDDYEIFKYRVYGGGNIPTLKKNYSNYKIKDIDKKLINNVLNLYAPLSNLELINIILNSELCEKYAKRKI